MGFWRKERIMDKRVYDLSPAQKKAFEKLRNAYRDCKRKGIFFVNLYGTLYAVDKKLICDYGDKNFPPNAPYTVPNHEGFESAESIRIPNEWSDDTHLVGLTEKGYKMLNEEE